MLPSDVAGLLSVLLLPFVADSAVDAVVDTAVDVVVVGTVGGLPRVDSFGLFNSVQRLPKKQLSPGAHSSPWGQGKLFAQSLIWSSHEIPQKFVLIIGALDGKDVDVVVVALDGDAVDRVGCGIFVAGTGLLLANSGC